MAGPPGPLGLVGNVSNHGDRKSSNLGCGSKWPKFMAEINGGDPNYLLSGVILQ